MAVTREGLCEDFRVIVGEDVVHLGVVCRVGGAVGDEGEEWLEWRLRLERFLADRRQLLGLCPGRTVAFNHRAVRSMMLFEKRIRAGHDGPRSRSRLTRCSTTTVPIRGGGQVWR